MHEEARSGACNVCRYCVMNQLQLGKWLLRSRWSSGLNCRNSYDMTTGSPRDKLASHYMGHCFLMVQSTESVVYLGRKLVIVFVIKQKEFTVR